MCLQAGAWRRWLNYWLSIHSSWSHRTLRGRRRALILRKSWTKGGSRRSRFIIFLYEIAGRIIVGLFLYFLNFVTSLLHQFFQRFLWGDILVPRDNIKPGKGPNIPSASSFLLYQICTILRIKRILWSELEGLVVSMSCATYIIGPITTGRPLKILSVRRFAI